ncbi:MAG: hypothetical protein SchgKO_24910 [Schleiferiaceae bacterium]
MSSFDHILINRRTVKPDRFSDALIPDSTVEELLELANWAPTHGFTEPWRFVVYTGEGKNRLVDFLIEQSRKTNGENTVREDKIRNRIAKSSHVIALGMARGDNPKIPELEEQLAVAMAVQNLWLAVHQRGLGGYWSTGSVAFSDELRDFMGLEAKDQSLGFFYLGIPAIEGLPGRRLSTGADKTQWVKS